MLCSVGKQSFRANIMVSVQVYESNRYLPPLGVWLSADACLGYVWMSEQNGLDLGRVDILAA